MQINTQLLAPIKNLENQVRLFIYDHTYGICHHQFTPMFNLLSYVTPLQYLLKEYWASNDDEREEELRIRLFDYLFLIVRNFRLLEKYFDDREITQDVWYSLYEAFKAIDEYTDCECVFEVEDFEPFMKI